MGPRAHEFLGGARKLELVTKVGRVAGDQDADGLPKKRSKKTAAGEQSRLPPSTNVSSPILNVRKRNGGRAYLQVEDDEDSDAAPAGPIHANGYAKDGFVVSSEADDDDYFEPMRPSTKGRQRTLDEMRRPAQGSRGGEVEVDEIHQDFVEQFVQEAKLAEERIRNINSLRKVLFTEQQLRVMAMRWTTSLSKMCLISGISQDNVKKYGGQLLPVLLKYHNFYRNAMGTGTDGACGHDDVVDLVSDGDDDGDDHGGHGHQRRRQLAAAAQARRSTKGKKPAQESFFSDEAEEDNNDDDEDSFEQSKYFSGGQGGAETAAEREGREWNERFEQAGEAAGARTKSRARNGAGSGAGAGGKSAGGWKGGKKSYARRSSGGGVAKRKTFSKKAAGATAGRSGGGASAARAGGSSGGGSATARAKASASGGNFGLMPL